MDNYLAKVRDFISDEVDGRSSEIGTDYLKEATDAFEALNDVSNQIKQLRAERDAFTAKLAEAKQALKPFAEIANKDVGMDEDDSDIYRPISPRNACAPLLSVGDLRRAARLTAEPAKGGEG